MKTHIDLQLIAIFGGGVLFNFLFWNEGLGVNLLLHTLFIFVVLLTKKEHYADKKTIIIAFSHLLAALLIVFNHSVLNIFGYYLTLIVFIGYTHAKQIKSVFTALLSGFLQLACSPINLAKKVLAIKIGNFSLKPIFRPIKYMIIPVFVVIFFSIIYTIANPVFAKYGETFMINLSNFIADIFSFIFGNLSFARFLHVILGILFTAGILLAFKENGLEKIDATSSENLIRKRKSKPASSFIHELKLIFLGSIISKKMALKTENIIGIISFSALNLLILILNVIDFNTLWLGNINSFDDTYLSTQLHEGANSLIFSIVMAMLVILYFFSGNINFFSKNKTLKLLAYAWIIQNTFLVFSVLIRDYHYINLSGLTHKRIGVLVFLILCIIGLFTLYIKVAQQKTLFYLLKINGQIWYVLLLVLGIVNWDVMIVNYNLNNRDRIALDLDHIMEMSDKALPLIAKNRSILKNYVIKFNYAKIVKSEVGLDTAATHVSKSTDTIPLINPSKTNTAQLALVHQKKAISHFDDDIKLRRDRFMKRWLNTSWLSWNYRDWQTYQYFTRNKAN